MKYNKYIHWYNSEQQIFMYNIFNNEILAISNQIYNLLVDYSQKLDKIKVIHPTLYELLLSKKFIVSDDFNETKELISIWDKKENNPQEFTITIIPTLNCNMSCWYCYEKHNKNTVMSTTVLENIKCLLDQKTRNKPLKILNINFFGGEPLICFNNICWNILEYAKKLCDKNKKCLKVHFTSNAYLINDIMIEKLKSLNCFINMQITLDGNKEKHDQIRHTKDGRPTFDKIISNIKLLISSKIFVNCRINYTENNIDTLADIIDYFSNIKEEERAFLNFNMQRVWQDYNNRNLKKEEEQIIKWFKNECLPISNPTLLNHRHCYADYENNFVINYDGNIFKCTARDFNTDISEGTLDNKGKICLNKRYKLRMKLKRGSDTCKQCKIYPICHANCSQYALDRIEKIKNNLCLFNYTEEEKEQKITELITAIISKSNESNNFHPIIN